MSEEQVQAQGEAAAAPAKKKKVNKLTMKEIDSRLENMVEKNLKDSIYYKHLLQRKSEIKA